MEGLPGWGINSMPEPPPRQHKHERQYTPHKHSIIPTRRIWNDDNGGQMIFGDLVGLKFPDICLTGEEKPRKNLTQEICPDRGSNPGPLRNRRTCYCLSHRGGQGLSFEVYFRRWIEASFNSFSYRNIVSLWLLCKSRIRPGFSGTILIFKPI